MSKATSCNAPWQVGHPSGSTSKSCWSRVAPAGRLVPLVGDIAQRPGQELQRVTGLGPRRRSLGLVRPVPDRRGGSVVGQPFEYGRIPRAVPGESGGEVTLVPIAADDLPGANLVDHVAVTAQLPLPTNSAEPASGIP